MRRREYLRSTGALGIALTGGCGATANRGVTRRETRTRTATESPAETRRTTVGNPESDCSDGSEVRIAYDPYEGVDWDTVTQHKCEFHNHVRGRMDEPADVVDLYRERDYTVYAVADNGRTPIKWPWTAFSDIDDSFEDRDPAELGVVAFPACEFSFAEHVASLFSTLTHRDVDEDRTDRRWEQAHRIVDRTDEYVPEGVGGLAVLAHPALYYWDPNSAWKRYRRDFASRTRERGMLGLEVFNRASIFGRDTILWDELLAAFAPDRMIWGFGVDDPTDYELGTDLDVNWTTLLMDESEFDPEDQSSSRLAAAKAMTAGRTLLNQRGTWDPETESPATVPCVEAIEIDEAGSTISIEASEYDTIKWVSRGSVASRDETVSLSADEVPYIRAHFSNAEGGVTSTQPFGLAAE